MKLSRALLERRELTKKIARLKEEIQASLITVEHESVPESEIEKKFELYDVLMIDLHQLNLKIDRANAHHLIEKLNSLRILDSRIDFLKTCRKTLISGNEMRYYSRNEVKDVKNLPIDTVNRTLEKLESDRNQLDSEIQEINWTIEI